MDYDKMSKKDLVAELMKFSGNLEREKETFNILYNRISDAIMTAELDDDGTLGKFIMVNDVACRRLGYSREELLTMSYTDICSEKMRPYLAARVNMTLQNGGAVLETEHVTKDGRIIPVEISTTVARYRGKTIFNSLIRDISDRIESAVLLRNVEQKFYTLFENSLDAIFMASPDGNIYAANQAACRMFGRTEAEFKMLGRGGVIDVNDPRLAVLLEERRKNGKVMGEVNCVRKDGTIFPSELSSAIFRDDTGRLLTSVIIRDITARKLVEEKVRQSEEKFNKAFNNSPDSIAITRASDGMLVEVNKALLDTSGYSREEMVGKTTGQLPLWADMNDRARYVTILNAKGSVKDFEAKLRTKSGALRDTVVSGDMFTINGELHILGIIRDVTESKEMQQALRESEERLRLSTELANVAVWEYDFETDNLSRSSNHDRLYGLEWQERWTMETFNEAVCPDDREYAGLALNKAISREASNMFTFDFRVSCPGDSVRWLNLIGEVISRDSSGRGTALRGCLIDVTERKNAEEKLRLSEELFHNAFHEGPTGITITRVSDGKFIDVNVAFLRTFEYERDEVIGKTSTGLNMWTPTERKRVFGEQMKSGGLENCEVVASSRTGKKINVLFSSRMVIVNGELCFLTTMIDVTDKKKAEEQIRKKDIQFSRLSSHLPDMIFQFLRQPDGSYNVPIASEGISNIFGCRPEDVANDFGPIARVIHPDDLDRVIGEIESSATNLTHFTTEFRVVIPGREQQWILGRSSPEKLSDGSIIWHGFCADITSKIKAEEKIREMKDTLENLNRYLIHIREEERASISRDIHDQLGQSLTAIKLDIDWLTRRIDRDSEEGRKIDVMGKLVSGTISDVQKIASELRPAILDDFGLTAAIEWYCEDFTGRTGLGMTIELDEIGSADIVSNLTLYRILQESLTNVIRHARARNVSVKLVSQGGMAELTVSDDGIGIPREKALSAKSMGILGMRERVKHAGGTFEISSPAGGGTCICVGLPIKTR
jgi:PAS domain S-box-containing protein